MNLLLPLIAALTLPSPSQEPAPAPASEVIELGPRGNRYAWDGDWLKLPDGLALGNTHGCVVVTADGRVVFNTDSSHAFVVVRPDGHVERTFGEEWRGGLHGMTIREEGGEEFLYIAHTGRHVAAKLDLAGEVQWTLPCPMESGKYESPEQYKPTAIAVAPDGRIFVADGYGQGWVHRYSAEREYLGSFGGPGTDAGRVRTPHGLVLEGTAAGPRLVVCDRENKRLQCFDLEGELQRVETVELWRPCSGALLPNGVLAVAELAGRVTLLGLDDEGERFALGHLGTQSDPAKRAQNGVAREDWTAGEFLSPHGVGADAEGNLYVLDWNRHGRVTRLARLDPLVAPDAPARPGDR